MRPVTFNHSILAAKDRHESAKFMADILGLAEPTTWGPFTSVEFDGGVTLQFAEPPVDEIQMQHYAFLVDDETFDACWRGCRRGGSVLGRPADEAAAARSTPTTVGGASTSSTPRGMASRS